MVFAVGWRLVARAGTMVVRLQCGDWWAGTMVFLSRREIGGWGRWGVRRRGAISGAGGDDGGLPPVGDWWQLVGGGDDVPPLEGD